MSSLVTEPSLHGKRALVTGAASGIGFSIAKLFLEAGAQVGLIDLNQDQCEQAAAKIQRPDLENVVAISCDVSQKEVVEYAFHAISERMGGPANILVNCAGIAHIGKLDTTSPGDFDRLFSVNVRGTYLTMRAVLEPMLEMGQGVILNLASIAATAGLPDRFAYSMTKGAVRAMTMSVARDYVARGIRCNCISPARVHTQLVDGFLARNYAGSEAEKMVELAAAQPIGRMGTPEEIAKLALYLCSEDASFVTGVDYAIDGGFLNLR